MYVVDLKGKNGIVFGVANEHSIAWAIAKMLHGAGARLTITYQNERFGERVSQMTESMKDVHLIECDVSKDESIEAAFDDVKREYGNLDLVLHSVAYANKDDLKGEFSKTTRSSFLMSLDISAYSLIPIVKHAAPLMERGGSIVTMTFQASERVFPGYNVMGTAKAALENEVRQLASEFGWRNIRVNAISAGPLETLASRGIYGFLTMRSIHAEKAPLKRNVTHEEVAKTALFLCSDLSSGITGSVIPVDAGYHIMAL
ncbi:MAG: Enoyl-[acyl-carrier-protein] reductase [Dehalococcoidia bacterium]|nr:Enoyl-[acyl-carrier-protein] reductase [Dehalococcoidia bacterium]